MKFKVLGKEINLGFNNDSTNETPALRNITDSTLSQFVNQYGWIFDTVDKNAGHYDLFYNAIRNPYVYRCVNTISNTLLINGFTIKNDDFQTPNPTRIRYLTDLFRNPESTQSNITHPIFLKQYIHSFEYTGDAFIEVNYEKFDYDKNNYYIINGFKYIPAHLLRYFNDTDQYGFRQDPNIRYENDELIHIYDPDITLKGAKFGVSKLEIIQKPLILQVLGLTHNQKILENNGIDPKAVLSFDKEISDTSFQIELQRLEEMSKLQQKGGTLAVKGATFQSGAISNQEMDYLGLMNLARDMIITTYGVPPAIAGIIETANLGSGSADAQKENFKDMMNGKAQLIEASFNKVLGHNGFDEIFQFNEMDLEDKLRRSQIEQTMIQANIRTVNEVRQDYGWDPVPWGDLPATELTGTLQESYDPLNPPWDNKTLRKYKNKTYTVDKLMNWNIY